MKRTEEVFDRMSTWYQRTNSQTLPLMKHVTQVRNTWNRGDSMSIKAALKIAENPLKWHLTEIVVSENNHLERQVGARFNTPGVPPKHLFINDETVCVYFRLAVLRFHRGDDLWFSNFLADSVCRNYFLEGEGVQKWWKSKWKEPNQELKDFTREFVKKLEHGRHHAAEPFMRLLPERVYPRYDKHCVGDIDCSKKWTTALELAMHPIFKKHPGRQFQAMLMNPVSNSPELKKHLFGSDSDKSARETDDWNEIHFIFSYPFHGKNSFREKHSVDHSERQSPSLLPNLHFLFLDLAKARIGEADFAEPQSDEEREIKEE